MLAIRSVAASRATRLRKSSHTDAREIFFFEITLAKCETSRALCYSAIGMMRAHALHLAAGWGSRRAGSWPRRARRGTASLRRPRSRTLVLSTRRRAVLVSLAVALLAAGCDEGRSSRPVTAPVRPRATPGAYEAVEVIGGGSLSGRVTWNGPLPEPVVVRGSMDTEHCGAEGRLPVLSVGARGGVAETVVVLDGISAGRALEIPNEPATLRIVGCAFEPHVLAIARGSRLRVENAEPVLHDARATDGRGTLRFDIGLPVLGASSELTLDEAGILRVLDDAGHPAMLGWVHVLDHPYFAVTDAEGRFRIDAIPPGTYSLRVWHEGVRSTPGEAVVSAPMLLTRSVSIQEGHATTVDFELDAAVAEAAGD